MKAGLEICTHYHVSNTDTDSAGAFHFRTGSCSACRKFSTGYSQPHIPTLGPSYTGW